METIYKDIILDHYKNPRNFGKIPQPSASSSLANSACGDKITIDLLLKSGKITALKFSGEGCAISIASTSLLCEAVKNKAPAEIMQMTIKDILKLMKINLSPTRAKCALLPLETLQKAIGLLQ